MNLGTVGRAVFLGGAVAAAAPVAAACTEPRPERIQLFGRRYSLLIGARAFLPASAQTRDRYASNDLEPELRLWQFNARGTLRFDWDVSYPSFGQDGQRARLLIPSAGLRLGMGRPERLLVPFGAVRAGPYLGSAQDSGFRARPGGNMDLGMAIANRAVLSARYDVLPRVDGVALSGYSVRVLFKLF